MKKFFLIFLLFPRLILSQNVIMQDAPAYMWRHGCAPTSMAMVIGFYDAHGYPDLIPGEPWQQNYIIDSIIASPKHYNDYSLPYDNESHIIPDKSSLGGAHPPDCIADFLRTSWSSENLSYGVTSIAYIPSAFKNYVESVYPNCIAECSEICFYSYVWDLYKKEINNNHPVMLLVDRTGDGKADHLMVGIGYNEALKKCIAYNTYAFGPESYDWRGLGKNSEFGIELFFITRISSGTETTRTSLLDNNYPNPFNPITTISFKIDVPSFTYLIIYNSTGAEVERPVSKYLSPGSYSTVWNGTNFASGVYFYQIRTNGHVETKKMILLK